jgi:hypothetical protein
MKRKKILFVGNHSAYHCGGEAVVNYLRKEIGTVGDLVEEGDDYDVLIVNGEGSMHHDGPTFQKKMAALEKSVQSGRKTFLVNSVWQANSNEHDPLLRRLDGIVVREQFSHDELKRKHGIIPMVRLDVSYWADIDEKAPVRKDQKDREVVGDFYSEEFTNFVRYTGGPFKRYSYIGMGKISWSSLVKELRTASLFVTGRHHGVFAACRARTPFVALKGNTHKIEGMVKISGLPIPVCNSPKELPDAIKWAQDNRSVYDDFFGWMQSLPRFTMADLGLAVDGMASEAR